MSIVYENHYYLQYRITKKLMQQTRVQDTTIFINIEQFDFIEGIRSLGV